MASTAFLTIARAAALIVRPIAHGLGGLRAASIRGNARPIAHVRAWLPPNHGVFERHQRYST